MLYNVDRVNIHISEDGLRFVGNHKSGDVDALRQAAQNTQSDIELRDPLSISALGSGAVSVWTKQADLSAFWREYRRLKAERPSCKRMSEKGSAGGY